MCIKVITVVGTRPEFIQTAPVSKILREYAVEILIHTGQHYDEEMSDVFFRDLDLPKPDINLCIGSGSHAFQTGRIMMEIEPIMLAEQPDWVLVYGDTNSTIAAALTAAKLHLRVAHIESGLRSFDRSMPEEINRITTDHLSDLLFAPTETAVRNLHREGIREGIEMVGDVRIDVLTELSEKNPERIGNLRHNAGLTSNQPFALATIHRPVNTDNPGNLRGIIQGLSELDMPVVLLAHPRLQKALQQHQVVPGDSVRLMGPAGFVDMMAWVNAASIIITDSGGLQKETYIMKRPTVTVRTSTEWFETVETGWNRLCAPNAIAIRDAVMQAQEHVPAAHPSVYGEYGVSQRIYDALSKHTAQ